MKRPVKSSRKTAKSARRPRSRPSRAAAPPIVTLSELRHNTLEELEALFAANRPLSVPAGSFRGELLQWLESPPAGHPIWRPVTALLFERFPFGVDFDERCWFFIDRRLKAGRFEALVGPSRWHDTRAIGLHYQGSRLPGPVKHLLYDEVKTLSADLCLGIGGIHLSGTTHRMFFFALEKMSC